MSATWVTLLFEAANFALLAAVLGWFFFRPVRDVLERRRAALEGEQRVAAEARREAEQALQEVEKRRVELDGSLEAQRAKVRREAESERQRLLDAAHEQTHRERDALDQELASLRRGQARSLAGDAACAAREIVLRLLETMDGPELEPTLLRAACRELEKLRASGSLAPITIESARALDAEAITSLAAAAGVDASAATHRIDPELVAGARVLTARGLVDTSAAGLAAQAERLLESQLDLESTGHD